jgi:hypothetical protein
VRCDYTINDLVVTPTARMGRIVAVIPSEDRTWRAEIAYLDTVQESVCIKAGLLRMPTTAERNDHTDVEHNVRIRKLRDDEIVPPCPTLYHLLFLMNPNAGEDSASKKGTPRPFRPRGPGLAGREAEIGKLMKRTDARGNPIKKQEVADMLGVDPSSLRKKLIAMRRSGWL